MAFYADLHLHSRYSRATSRDCDLEHLAWWARRKGISVVATGDFTHPAWFDELREKLVPAEPGLFRLRPEIASEVERNLPAACRGEVRFLLEVEISTIYKKGDKTRKVHHLIYAAGFDTAQRIRERLGAIGNLASDGRPILGLDSRDLLEITLEAGDDAYLVPAHIWTPWFSTLGSKSGFDSIEECYGDLAGEIFAVETGLSSDPPMNWRVSSLDRFTLVSNSDAHSPPMLGREACAFDCELDYFALRRALETGEGYRGTVEFFPEEGKYHLDGHRACGVRLEPEETLRHQGRCPTCGKPVTVGVMHRVERLADRPGDDPPPGTSPYRCLVPLPEIVGEICQVGPRSKRVERTISGLVSRLGPELEILERLPAEEVERSGGPLLAEALTRLRAGAVRREAGYDGEYGVIRLFEPGEVEARSGNRSLFPGAAPGRRAGKTGGEAPPAAPAQERPASTAAEPSPQSAAPPDGRETPAEPAAAGPGQLALVLSSVLEGLDPEQRAAAEVVRGPLLVVAGPGTGKTRTLTHRLAHLVAEAGVPAERCLAVTFTRRAAGEMRQRLDALLPGRAGALRVTTFHGLGATLLRELHGEVGLLADFRLADPAECAALAGELFALPPAQAGRLLTELGQRRRAGATPLDEQAAAYEEALRARALVDFDGLLALPVRLFDARPELAARYRERWAWISIDEYQDVDALQYRLVRQLAPAGANLCAIGDPDQSIYRFRGADVGFFLRFQEDYPGTRLVHLHRNYRSSPTIVDAALQLIRPASLVEGRRLEAARALAPERITVLEAADEREEAERVAHAIEALLGGTSYYSLDSGRVGVGEGRELSFGDFAVLYRTAAQAAPLAQALGQAGIPFQERSHGPLTERPGVAPLLAALRAEADGEGDDAAAGGTPARSVEARLHRAAERLGRSGGEGEAARAPRAVLAAAAQLLAPLAARWGDDLPGFLGEAALEAEVDLWDPRAERVSLLTLHAAKGLEFPVVFLVGCDDGLLPLTWPGGDDADRDEERRLFFVGVTRAQALLHLTRARRRRLWGQERETRPSPFLADVEESLLARRRAPRAERPPGPRQMRLL